MASKYVVRQPIKNRTSRIIGYEIQYYGENQAFGVGNAANDIAAADTIYSFLTSSTDKLLSGSLNFMTFTTTLLMKKTPRLFNKDELVIQIDDSVLLHPLGMHMLQQYAKEGYKIAVNEFQFAPRYLAMLNGIDYIRLNMQSMEESAIRNLVEIAHSMNKVCIAVGVDREELYRRAMELDLDAMEGSFVAEKTTQKAHSSGYMQSNFFRLMAAVLKDEPDVDQIERIISVDASLSYGLLRIANSRYFSMRSKVNNVRQAIMTIGLNDLKQWVYLLSASNEDNQIDEGAEEFLKLSLMRANFCARLMNYAVNVPIDRSDAYLMGMFSTLNYLIDAPMEEILKQIPLCDAVKDALLRHEGRCGMLYDLALCYERADWKQIERLAGELGIQTNLLTSVYFSCMEEVNHIWSEVSRAHNEQI